MTKMSKLDAKTRISDIIDRPEVIYLEISDEIIREELVGDTPLNGMRPRVRSKQLIIRYSVDERLTQMQLPI